MAPAAQPFLDLDPNGAAFDAKEVILFSGGLESFAGALEALCTSTNKVILLTHRSAQKAIPRQVELGKYLAQRFPGRVLHIHVKARRVGQEASALSQRSRSFLFAALGQLVTQSFGAERLGFYENGVISHNLPISSQVVGTMATRTTHPLSLLKLNTLMQLLGPRHVPIENRYLWLTNRAWSSASRKTAAMIRSRAASAAPASASRPRCTPIAAPARNASTGGSHFWRRV
jgi:hypothetical protein